MYRLAFFRSLRLEQGVLLMSSTQLLIVLLLLLLLLLSLRQMFLLLVVIVIVIVIAGDAAAVPSHAVAELTFTFSRRIYRCHGGGIVVRGGHHCRH